MPTTATPSTSRPFADLTLPQVETSTTKPQASPSSTTVGSTTPTPNLKGGLCVDDPINGIHRFLQGKRITIPDANGPRYLFKTFRTGHKIGGRPILGLIATTDLLSEVAANLKTLMPSSGFPPALKALASEIDRTIYSEITNQAPAPTPSKTA